MSSICQIHCQKEKLEAELARHGKGKCVPADEFERAKEPIFAEGMRAGCEDLMREAARMDTENEQLKENARRRQEQVERLEAELARLREENDQYRGQRDGARKNVEQLEAELAGVREELETAENEGYKLGWQQAMEQEHPPEETT